MKTRDIMVLNALRRENPVQYAKICERNGDKEEAMRYYARSKYPDDVFYAAKIAYKLGKCQLMKNYFKKAKSVANEEIMAAKQWMKDMNGFAPRVKGTGHIERYKIAKYTRDRITEEISELEEKLK